MIDVPGYPVLFLIFLVASLLGALFVRLGVRWNVAFDVPFWNAFSATLLAWVVTLVAGVLLYFGLGASQHEGSRNTFILLMPLLLWFVTALLYGFMIRYPRGEGAVGMAVGARVAIVQLGLTALTGMALVAATYFLSNGG